MSDGVRGSWPLWTVAGFAAANLALTLSVAFISHQGHAAVLARVAELEARAAANARLADPTAHAPTFRDVAPAHPTERGRAGASDPTGPAPGTSDAFAVTSSRPPETPVERAMRLWTESSDHQAAQRCWAAVPDPTVWKVAIEARSDGASGTRATVLNEVPNAECFRAAAARWTLPPGIPSVVLSVLRPNVNLDVPR